MLVNPQVQVQVQVPSTTSLDFHCRQLSFT